MSGISDGSIVVITPPPDTKGGPPGVLDAGSNKANAASNITPPNPLPVPEEVSPSQDVWEQAEEDQPIDPNNPPKPKADGTPRKPKLNYFWKVNIEAKDAGKVAWNPVRDFSGVHSLARHVPRGSYDWNMSQNHSERVMLTPKSCRWYMHCSIRLLQTQRDQILLLRNQNGVLARREISTTHLVEAANEKPETLLAHLPGILLPRQGR